MSDPARIDCEDIAKTLAEELSAARAQPVSRPTWLETEMAKRREEMRATCTYPLREFTVLTPEQLELARDRLGSGRVYVHRQEGDRRPLTREELEAARAASRDIPTGWERD